MVRQILLYHMLILWILLKKMKNILTGENPNQINSILKNSKQMNTGRIKVSWMTRKKAENIKQKKPVKPAKIAKTGKIL